MVLPFPLPSVWQPEVDQYPVLLLSLLQKAQISSCLVPGISHCEQVGAVVEVSLDPTLGCWAWVEPKEGCFSFGLYLLSTYCVRQARGHGSKQGRHKSLSFWG